MHLHFIATSSYQRAILKLKSYSLSARLSQAKNNDIILLDQNSLIWLLKREIQQKEINFKSALIKLVISMFCSCFTHRWYSRCWWRWCRSRRPPRWARWWSWSRRRRRRWWWRRSRRRRCGRRRRRGGSRWRRGRRARWASTWWRCRTTADPCRRRSRTTSAAGHPAATTRPPRRTRCNGDLTRWKTNIRIYQ